MIFSQRYHHALKDGKLVVAIPEDARRKIYTCLESYNSSVSVQRDPNDNWISNSSVFEETVLDLIREHGWDDIPEMSATNEYNYYDASKHIIRNLGGGVVFDYIELAMPYMGDIDRESCRIKINQIFDVHLCPWRLADGEFFKLDADFVGERLTATAHDALAANRFVGAAQEYAKARQELAAGDVKDSIFYAAKSFESVLKVLTGQPQMNVDQLVKSMVAQNYFDDLPETMRAGFADQVLKTLPFLRNKLAGHGQGADIVEIPAVYGELALQLAATLHNLLISKHLERNPPPPPKPTDNSMSYLDDDIPF
ncbi:AbiJ-NTD4 domain-containing protein [Methylobacterium sp. WSM2598]|uniref:AbiJ-NTD4 domain-containing protein n=1 Tax=Methylobacterium sp. WSM2598 TaxID=398261 RepID=UPI0012F6E3B3|nr:hypothetical protein [Methylobacterium sp. WSM2598]